MLLVAKGTRSKATLARRSKAPGARMLLVAKGTRSKDARNATHY